MTTRPAPLSLMLCLVMLFATGCENDKSNAQADADAGDKPAGNPDTRDQARDDAYPTAKLTSCEQEPPRPIGPFVLKSTDDDVPKPSKIPKRMLGLVAAGSDTASATLPYEKGGPMPAKLKALADKFGKNRVAMILLNDAPRSGPGPLMNQLRPVLGDVTIDFDVFPQSQQIHFYIAPIDDVDALSNKVPFGELDRVDRPKRLIVIDYE